MGVKIETLYQQQLANTVEPGTPRASILEVLAENHHYGFTAQELAQITDIDTDVVQTALEALHEGHLVGDRAEYYYIPTHKVEYITDYLDGREDTS